MPEESGGRHALPDERGTLIASGEPDFVVADGDWLQTLPRHWSRVFVPMQEQGRNRVVTHA
jgi:hypothetical protein